MKTHLKIFALLAAGIALVGCGGMGTNHTRMIPIAVINFSHAPAEIAFVKLLPGSTYASIDNPGLMYFDSPYPVDPLTGESPIVTIPLADYERLGGVACAHRSG